MSGNKFGNVDSKIRILFYRRKINLPQVVKISTCMHPLIYKKPRRTQVMEIIALLFNDFILSYFTYHEMSEIL